MVAYVHTCCADSEAHRTHTRSTRIVVVLKGTGTPCGPVLVGGAASTGRAGTCDGRSIACRDVLVLLTCCARGASRLIVDLVAHAVWHDLVRHTRRAPGAFGVVQEPPGTTLFPPRACCTALAGHKRWGWTATVFDHRVVWNDFNVSGSTVSTYTRIRHFENLSLATGRTSHAGAVNHAGPVASGRRCGTHGTGGTIQARAVVYVEARAVAVSDVLPVGTCLTVFADRRACDLGSAALFVHVLSDCTWPTVGANCEE